MKIARKVSLIDVRDCTRDDHTAYWNISVTGNAKDGVRWEAKIMSYEPLGFEWQGKFHKEWPEGVPAPLMPSDRHLLREKAYNALSAAEKLREQARQEAFRAQCAAIHEASPKAVHLISAEIGAVIPDDLPEPARSGTPEEVFAALEAVARTESQDWVRAEMKKHRKPKPATVSGYAIPLPLDPLGDLVREVRDGVRYLWRKYARPLLMAIAYSQTIRHNMLHQLRDAIDGGAGAGLLRIYDGSRPATCGTATTLGAELTYTDPCAGAASGGALTFSAITADASANASITASWYRSVDSTGTCCEDGNCGTSGSDLNFNTLTITAGVQVAVTSKVITGGNA